MQDLTALLDDVRQHRLDWTSWLTQVNQRILEHANLNAVVNWQPDTYRSTLEPTAPFFGYPVLTKALGQAKAGWPSTSASRLLADNIAQQSDYFITKLEAAGMQVVGQTNSPEFGFTNITNSALYGPARNPWNSAYFSGGSSGGAAAAVAAGIVPLATASDGGGSIRIPASFCGLIGLKPSRGTMPTGPSDWRNWQGAAINFGLTVSMRDTKLLFKVLKQTGSTPAPYQPPLTSQTTAKTNAGPLKIGFIVDSPVQTPVSQEAKAAVLDLVSELEKMGHQVGPVNWPCAGQPLMESYYAMNAVETDAMLTQIANYRDRPIQPDEVEPLTWTLYQYGRHLPGRTYVAALNLWDQAAAQMAEFFKAYDLLLTPSTADHAPKVTQSFQNPGQLTQMQAAADLNTSQLAQLTWDMFAEGLALTPFTQLANLTGLPAISLPTHLTKTGLPLGCQLMAPLGREDLLFVLGQAIEDRGLFVLPSAYQ